MKPRLIVLFFFLGFSNFIYSGSRPGLILTKKGVNTIKYGENIALFQKNLDAAIIKIDALLNKEIVVPIPKDLGGGYTHEQHKRNYKIMQLAGTLYQLTDNHEYADYVKQMLLAYARIFTSFPNHPSRKSYAPGKFFWQCLNDANWLVYTSQAYDAIYDYLDSKQRNIIENDLLVPYANYISIKQPQFFNRIHNHSTWGNAAVGMVALAINDDEMLNRALYGLPLEEQNTKLYDNDGGYLYENQQAKAGFLAQIDNAFSPDGFYEEGPYYQRYAMTPFILFATALNNNRPDLNVFHRNDGVLLKAVYALINQTNSAGEFYPINDCQKGMSLMAPSVIASVDVAYDVTNDDLFLAMAKQQNEVMLNQYGYKVASELEKRKLVNINTKSTRLSDGKDGLQGALGVIKTDNPKELSFVFKATGQGKGHGHFDKLGILVYNGPNEVLQDYGSARWVNVEQKQGGRYLPENKSYAKQTIAHNALLIDGESHFYGKYSRATDKHSDLVFFDSDDSTFQTCIGIDTNAYEGVSISRYTSLIDDSSFSDPFILDIVESKSDEEHNYDLPYQFKGGFISSNPSILRNPTPKIMGSNHGLEHVYVIGDTNTTSDNYSFTWFRNKTFYTITGLANKNDRLKLGQIGANDPEFNLRPDQMLIHSKSKSRDGLFISTIEAHGKYSYVSEVPLNLKSAIQSITVLENSNQEIVVSISNTKEEEIVVVFQKLNFNKTFKNKLNIRGEDINYTGPKYKKKYKKNGN